MFRLGYIASNAAEYFQKTFGSKWRLGRKLVRESVKRRIKLNFPFKTKFFEGGWGLKCLLVK